jgi:hypothetical protein
MIAHHIQTLGECLNSRVAQDGNLARMPEPSILPILLDA